MTTTNRASRQEIEVPLPASIVGGAFVLWAIAHAVMTRTAADFLRYPLYFAVPASVILLAILVRDWWKSTPRHVSSDTVWMAFLLPIAFYAVAAAYYAIGASIKDAYFWLQALDLTRPQKIALAVGIALAAGLLLFVFRLKLRSTYGLTEALVGLLVAESRVASDLDKYGSDPTLYLPVLTAGVYLVVRGLDNVHQGLATDPIAIRLLALMRGPPGPMPAPAVAASPPAVAAPTPGPVADSAPGSAA